ncbi:4-hydroxyphenylpyruvate dioxygenase [Paraglaciecola sp. 2405UD69-4]|uniref:4-hydroxyphenylpyruvate dioxygenase n=1 Tax=Paraglaciecola sp. 2405UD69-4 TaxID=3391836 RepID=UPI0039C9198F
MENSFINVEGISFIEFTGSKPNLLIELFESMGLKLSHHKEDSKITLHQHGNINFISNPSDSGNVKKFRAVHNRGASALGFKVENSEVAFKQAIELGAEAAELANYDIPAIKGIGTSIVYLVDKDSEAQLLGQFEKSTVEPLFDNCLCEVDHLTHNLYSGGIEKQKAFYGKIFGFASLRTFDIEGKKTGLLSEVIASPNGKVIIPLNETKDDKSQIAEYLQEYNGEGIQHIALRSTNLFNTVDNLHSAGIEFQDTPDTYYDLLNDRLPGHGESVEKLKERRILVDGGEKQGGGYLLQIFTKNSIGPIFFEYIQRKGNKGFGEGNFQALFESIELDQEQRGVI